MVGYNDAQQYDVYRFNDLYHPISEVSFLNLNFNFKKGLMRFISQQLLKVQFLKK